MNYDKNNDRQSPVMITLSAKLIFDPLVMYFTENLNVVGISGVNVCPVFRFGFPVPQIVLKVRKCCKG